MLRDVLKWVANPVFAELPLFLMLILLSPVKLSMQNPVKM